jgi:hypothetical protein
MLQQLSEELQSILWQAPAGQGILRAHGQSPIIHPDYTPATRHAEVVFPLLRGGIQASVQTLWNQGPERLPHCRHVQRLYLCRHRILDFSHPLASSRDAPRNFVANFSTQPHALRVATRNYFGTPPQHASPRLLVGHTIAEDTTLH